MHEQAVWCNVWFFYVQVSGLYHHRLAERQKIMKDF